MQPKDSVVPAGNRLAPMVLFSDRDFTIRPAPARSSRSTWLPVVGGKEALADAIG